MNVLVTGNAGMIGSHLADMLVKKGHSVVGIDDLSGGEKVNINENVRFFEYDLKDPSAYRIVEGIVKHFDIEALFHCQTSAAENKSLYTPLFDTRNNVMGYMSVLTACIKQNVKWMGLFSSMAVYGAQETPFNEDIPRQPQDPYATAKTLMELNTENLAKVYGFKYCIFRPHNVIGIRQNRKDPYRNVACLFMEAIKSNKNIYIFGEGHKRAFSYVGDVAKACINAMEKGITNEIINLGGKTPIIIIELANKIVNMSRKLGVTWTGQIVQHPARVHDVKDAYCTVDKSIDLLGFTETALDKSLEEMFEWVLEQDPVEKEYMELELNHPDIPEVWKKKLY